MFWQTGVSVYIATTWEMCTLHLHHQTHVTLVGTLQQQCRVWRFPCHHVDCFQVTSHDQLFVHLQGKKLMLITNSDYHYTNKMMSYAYNQFLPRGSTWRDLFNMVCHAISKVITATPSCFASTSFCKVASHSRLCVCTQHKTLSLPGCLGTCSQALSCHACWQLHLLLDTQCCAAVGPWCKQHCLSTSHIGYCCRRVLWVHVAGHCASPKARVFQQ